MTPLPPLPLRVHTTDPRYLVYDDGLVGEDAIRAATFMDRHASAHELLLALRLGLHRLLYRFPRLALDTPNLLTATVLFCASDVVVRRRDRAEATADARTKRVYVKLVVKLVAANRNDYHFFSDAAVGAALASLVATKSRPCHLLFAYKFLLCAPAVRVAKHPLASAVGESVRRLRSVALTNTAERLVKRLAHPDAINFEYERAAALGDAEASH